MALPSVTHPAAAVEARGEQVVKHLTAALDKWFLGYRTFDGKPLTYGEVQIAFGRIVGAKTKDAAKAALWMKDIYASVQIEVKAQQDKQKAKN